LEQFEQIIDKYCGSIRTFKSKTTIEEIENIISFRLPSDYKAFLQNYYGFEGSIGQEYLRLWNVDEILESNKGYNIFDYLTNTIGIGGNCGGEFIAIEITDSENYRIVLSPFIDLDKQYHIEIGKSFTDFLVRLENGIKWFD